jgi:hypothetical protein
VPGPDAVPADCDRPSFCIGGSPPVLCHPSAAPQLASSMLPVGETGLGVWSQPVLVAAPATCPATSRRWRRHLPGRSPHRSVPARSAPPTGRTHDGVRRHGRGPPTRGPHLARRRAAGRRPGRGPPLGARSAGPADGPGTARRGAAAGDGNGPTPDGRGRRGSRPAAGAARPLRGGTGEPRRGVERTADLRPGGRRAPRHPPVVPRPASPRGGRRGCSNGARQMRGWSTTPSTATCGSPDDR